MCEPVADSIVAKIGEVGPLYSRSALAVAPARAGKTTGLLEVWKLFGVVEAEFGRFGDLPEGVEKRRDQASSTMGEVARRSRVIDRKLRKVEELPAAESQLLIGSNGEGDMDELTEGG
jgi:hypothetical protein